MHQILLCRHFREQLQWRGWVGLCPGDGSGSVLGRPHMGAAGGAEARAGWGRGSERVRAANLVFVERDMYKV